MPLGGAQTGAEPSATRPSAGVTLVVPWDGHGMAATQSHAMAFKDSPATRSDGMEPTRGAAHLHARASCDHVLLMDPETDRSDNQPPRAVRCRAAAFSGVHNV